MAFHALQQPADFGAEGQVAVFFACVWKTVPDEIRFELMPQRMNGCRVLQVRLHGRFQGRRYIVRFGPDPVEEPFAFFRIDQEQGDTPVVRIEFGIDLFPTPKVPDRQVGRALLTGERTDPAGEPEHDGLVEQIRICPSDRFPFRKEERFFVCRPAEA